MKLAKAVANSADQLVLGAGARFWVYLSPENETVATITQWRVTFSQDTWSDFISNDDPTKNIQTPGLSGIFDIEVALFSAATNTWRKIPPQQGSNNEIGCNDTCASMVRIVADSTSPLPGAINAHFWTTWDALCG